MFQKGLSVLKHSIPPPPPKNYVWGLGFASFMHGKVGDKKDPVPVAAPFLLPREVVHELHRTSPLQVGFLQTYVLCFVCIMCWKDNPK